MEENYTYMGRNIGDLSINNDHSAAFSECNSDRSGEFTTAGSDSRRLLISCATENSDDLVRQLVANLESCSIDEQKQAAMEIRLLAKNKPENRLKIARAGAIKPLISLIASSDPQLQENGVTAILNLSLCDENKGTHSVVGSNQTARQSSEERNANGEGERGLCSAPPLAGRGEQGGDRTVRSDSTAREFARERRFPGEKGRIDGSVLALFGQGEQIKSRPRGDHEAFGGIDG
ncbi:hypothetical protein L1049_026382 [Liquidambar formosana]|uniref:Uncharacterized protein n=1 Tax=Liquidambar formosana TaxID=63359 RepID=A0AAP0NCM9_LIQFO